MRRVLAALVLSGACGSPPSSAPAPETKAKSILEPRGIEESKRVRKDVDDAHKAGLQRNDDALDRATKPEATPRGQPAGR